MFFRRIRMASCSTVALWAVEREDHNSERGMLS